MDNNQYWRGIEELDNKPEFKQRVKNEFMEGIPLDKALSNELDLSSNRRDFLKFFGFSISAAALAAACNKAPVKNAIPYAFKPEEITPGVANYYASTCNACTAGCGILVKTREGRPVKVEGNPEHKISKGGVCAIGHADLLNLYDNARLDGPMKGGNKTTWADLDAEIVSQLGEISKTGGNIRIISGTINSPSTKSVIADFISKYPTTRHIQYEAFSSFAIVSANNKSFGKAVLPSYNFGKAKVIVSVAADFLGTWISPVEFTQQYVSGRKTNNTKNYSRHFQFETSLSLTGSNADVRIPITPSQEGVVLLSIYNKLATKAGAPTLNGTSQEFAVNMIENASNELWNAKGSALVVSGSNDVDVQLLVNAINSLLGSYGNTIDLDNYSNQSSGNDAEFEAFVSEMNEGKVGAVIFYNTNPAYSYYNPSAIESGLKKVKLVVSTSSAPDETSGMAKYIAPDNHGMESWNDTEAKKGKFSLSQPTIAPIFLTRQVQSSLLVWSGAANTDYYSYLKNNWAKLMPEADWTKVLHDGFYEVAEAIPSSYTNSSDLASAATSVSKTDSENKGKLQVKLYEKVGLRSGKNANNPWLQELPDPISKVTWDNYAATSVVVAANNKVEDFDVISLSVGKVSSKLPVLRQPGQANNTISVAVGYGRTIAGKVGENLGVNVFPLVRFANGSFQYNAYNVSIAKVEGEQYKLAQTQTHHTIEGRNHYREASLAGYVSNPKVIQQTEAPIISLWEERDYKGHKWVMAVDLNACTGCGACVIACNNENNVPVVGKEQVMIGREMHWMRIDRYYSFKNSDNKYREDMYEDMHTPDGEKFTNPADFENVTVGFQPLMCHHCGHAPCETVCPVLATVHSGEGLNQMTYNRCIGTKYCANNCPYKVRRFNWYRFNDNDKFDYNLNNDLGKMVINPDVTVRTRGVMEKCSFCVQRIQETKLSAKRENRKVKDGDMKTACQQSCPANAIVFGDVNDPESEVSKLFKNERSYEVLAEIGVEPSVKYLGKIRNTISNKA